MSANSDLDINLNPARFKFSKGNTPLDLMSDNDHDSLLQYLTARLKSGNHGRGVKLSRYASIDKLISTWQKLNPADSKRDAEEDNTGRTQALPMNLPLLATHLEDMVSFFAELYAPTGRNFYTIPTAVQAEGAKMLANKMNQDTKARKYYKEICSTFRTLLKYNVGGFSVTWEEGLGVGQAAQAGNRVESIDMYNYLWDPSIRDVARICTDAEWAARISLKNRTWLTRKALKGSLARINELLTTHDEKIQMSNSRGKMATYFKFPPSHVGLTVDGKDSRTSAGSGSVDWASYGAGLESDTAMEIPGFEVVEMFCWVNPTQLKLKPSIETDSVDDNDESLELWRFVIIDNCQVCRADPVAGITGEDPEIPHYLCYHTQDDMKEAQRSVMEMMRGFQRFGSFLMNIYVAGARKNTWGMKGYDPQMIDMSAIDKGDVAGWIPSKQPGRDIRTGLMSLDTSSNIEDSFKMLSQMLELVRVFYPSQGQPAQIAGIDRAVKSQVSAVLQGSTRRLHMSSKLMDADMMSPMRIQQYRNLVLNEAEGLQDLKEEDVGQILGSGLSSIDSERIVGEIKEIIMALMQNPQVAQTYDLAKIFSYMGRLLNSPFDLGDFVLQQVQQVQGAGLPVPPMEGQ